MPPPLRTTVRAQGQAMLSHKPDRVRIEIGVTTQAPTAQGAATQNAKQVADVIATLKKELGPSAELQTTNYSLHPNYTHPRNGGTPVIAGYNAQNVVRVQMDDVASAGKIIDAATRTGANTVHGIQFLVKDEQGARSQVLGAAAKQARQNAEAMANALGLKVVRVLSVDDSQPVMVQPMRRMAEMAAQAADVSTSIEPGSIEVRATATVTLEVAP